MRTIFPHKAGSNPTLLSFDEGDIILLLLQEERDGWLYGEVDATKQYVFRTYSLFSAALCHLETGACHLATSTITITRQSSVFLSLNY